MAAKHEVSERYEELRRRMLVAVSQVCPPWLSNEKDDLVQAALVRLMRADERAEGEAEFSARYLYRVAHNLLVDEVRRRQVRKETPLEEDSAGPYATLPADTPDPERRSYARELGRAIQECLERLVPPRRRAVTLALGGHPNREVAALMGWKRRVSARDS